MLEKEILQPPSCQSKPLETPFGTTKKEYIPMSFLSTLTSPLDKEQY